MAKGNEAKLRMVCAACSSDDVARYGWAQWNIEVQEWKVGAVFDLAFCQRCRVPTHVEPRPLRG